MALKTLWLGIFGKLQREFSEDRPEMMDLPGHDENELRRDLENLGHINRTFGGRRAVADFPFVGWESCINYAYRSGFGVWRSWS